MAARLDQVLTLAYQLDADVAARAAAARGDPARLVAVADLLAAVLGDRLPQVPPPAAATWTPLPAQAAPPPAARAAAVADLLAWAEAGGARFDSVRFTVDAAGHCSATAARDLAAGEAVVVVPRALMIFEDELASSAAGQISPYGNLRVSMDTLATWLALEADLPASPWRAFLAALPRSFPTSPWFRDLDEQRALAGTAAATAAATEVDVAHDFHALLDPELPVSLAAFAWGRAITRSRGYRVTVDGRERCALIPVVDLLDHQPGDTTWDYQPDQAAYVVTTARAIAAGEPVHATYGFHDNGALLRGYGFALDDNPADTARLRFAPSRNVRAEVLAASLWRFAPGAASVEVAARADLGLHRALWLLRLRHADGGALHAAAASGQLSDRGVGWLGVATEVAALAELAATARAGVVELDAAAPPPGTSPWARACDQVRAGERATLTAVADFADAARDVLAAAPSLTELRAAAAPHAAATTGTHAGARYMLAGYLAAVADELARESSTDVA
ncbi:MAG: SET domain-containing protein [Kofleriaceae bacterium]